MKISAIIPVKNRAGLLPVTLDCLLRQTLLPYEIIVVDDASTDEIESVKKKYSSSVIFTNSKGKGPGAARNTGMQIATGKLIQFFDSDDLMTKNKLEIQAGLIQEKNVDFVYGPYVKAKFENEKWIQDDVIMQYYPVPNESFAGHVLQGWCNITQAALFTSDILKEAGRWREDIFTHEDYEYWFRIAQFSNRYAHENESCVVYRQHQQQITLLQIAEQKKWRNEIAALELIKNEMNYKPSWHTMLMFKGREYHVKSGYVKRFQDKEGFEIESKNRFIVPYFKLFNKIRQMQTGTTWQKMHGVLSPGKQEFARYISMLP